MLKSIRIKQYLIVLASVTVLAVSGCGDNEASSGASAEDAGGEEITVETGSLPKVQFVKQANAICDESGDKAKEEFLAFINDNASRLGKEDKEEALAEEATRDVVIPIYEEEIEQISALGAPSGDEDEIAAVLNALQEDLETAKAEPVAFIQTETTPFTVAEQPAKAYGLTVCVER